MENKGKYYFGIQVENEILPENLIYIYADRIEIDQGHLVCITNDQISLLIAAGQWRSFFDASTIEMKKMGLEKQLIDFEKDTTSVTAQTIRLIIEMAQQQDCSPAKIVELIIDFTDQMISESPEAAAAYKKEVIRMINQE